MKMKHGISLKVCVLLLATLLAGGNALAQGSGQADKEDDTKCKQDACRVGIDHGDLVAKDIQDEIRDES